MSSLICWPTYYCDDHGKKVESSRHITIIADSLFSRTSDSVRFKSFFESGPKICSVPVRSFGFGQKLNYTDSFGLGFVGNTIVGQSALLLAANTFHNLHYMGVQIAELPFLAKFADCIGQIAVELFEGYHEGQKNLDLVLVGVCPKTKRQAACHINIRNKKAKTTQYFLEDDDEILVFGNDATQISNEIAELRKESPHDFSRIWAPKDVLYSYVQRKHKDCIGGTIHGGTLMPDLGFVAGCVAVYVPKKRGWFCYGLPPKGLVSIGRFGFAPQPMEYEWAPVFSKR